MSDKVLGQRPCNFVLVVLMSVGQWTKQAAPNKAMGQCPQDFVPVVLDVSQCVFRMGQRDKDARLGVSKSAVVDLRPNEGDMEVRASISKLETGIFVEAWL